MHLETDGIDPSESSHQPITTNGPTPPLFFAVQEDHEEAARMLPDEEGILVNKAAANGVTPLCAAAGRGHVAVVELLLGEEGVAVNQESNQIKTKGIGEKMAPRLRESHLLAPSGRGGRVYATFVHIGPAF